LTLQEGILKGEEVNPITSPGGGKIVRKRGMAEGKGIHRIHKNTKNETNETIRKEDTMEKFITVNEACKLLNISRATLYRYLSAKAIPSIKEGKGRLFPEEGLREWLERQRKGDLPLVFKLRWIRLLQKWMDRMQQVFDTPGKIETLSFREQLALAEHIGRFMNRSTKFMLRMREGGLNPGASSYRADRHRKLMVNVMFS